MEHLDPSLRSTRSAFRLAGYRGVPRQRKFLQRWTIFSAALIVGAGLIWLVETQQLGTQGPGAVLYWLHDTYYLTAKGRIWTAWFPYVLIWLVPTLFFALLLLFEFLAGGGAIRAIHRRLIRQLVAGPTGRRLVQAGMRGMKRPIDVSPLFDDRPLRPRFLGFAQRVVAEMQVELMQAAAQQLAKNQKFSTKDCENLLGISWYRLQIGWGAPEPLVAAFEAIALVSIQAVGRTQAVARFGQYFAAQDLARPGSPDPALNLDSHEGARVFNHAALQDMIYGAFGRLTMPNIETNNVAYSTRARILTAASDPARVQFLGGGISATRVMLATEFLGLVQPAFRHWNSLTLPKGHYCEDRHLSELRAYVLAWRHARISGEDGASAHLAWVEEKVNFEFWLLLAERCSTPAAHEGLLADAVTLDTPAEPLGEIFAWHGTWS